MTTATQQFTFEVVPARWQPGDDFDTFEPFVMDVPGIGPDAHARAARRAYFSAMSYLRQLEPEQFQVFEWADDRRGREVGPGGFVEQPVPVTSWVGYRGGVVVASFVSLSLAESALRMWKVDSIAPLEQPGAQLEAEGRRS